MVMITTTFVHVSFFIPRNVAPAAVPPTANIGANRQGGQTILKVKKILLCIKNGMGFHS